MASNTRQTKRKLSESDSDSIKIIEEPVEASDRVDVYDETYNTFHKDKSMFYREKFSHKLFGSFNKSQHPVQNFSELMDFPSVTVSIPRPIYVAPKHCNSVDICERRTSAKINYTIRLKRARAAYISATKNNRQVRKLEKNNIYPESVYVFAERLEKNPDEYFNEKFDFYYSGGNLCALQDSQYIVHASGENLHSLEISKFSDHNELTEVFNGNLSDKEIFEMQQFKSSRDDLPNTFVMRQRNCISIHSYNDEGHLKTIKSFKSKQTPFISFAQNRVDLNILAISNLKHQVRLYDLAVNKAQVPLLQMFSMSGGISWNSIKCLDKNTYVYTGLKQFSLMDIRIPPTNWLRNSCKVDPTEMACINFCSLALSGFDNLLYVGSTHNLYCVDLRCLGRFIDGRSARGTLCRWTHQMSFPPLMLDTHKSDSNTEVIALSSPASGDIRICENVQERFLHGVPLNDASAANPANLRSPVTDKQFIYKSLCLPYQPPTLEEAYETARLHGKCLQPDSDLKNRIQCSTTGMKFYESRDNVNNCYMLLTSNSNGDVFAQTISNRSNQEHFDRTDESTTEIISRYENKVRNLIQPPLNFTEVIDMSGFNRLYRCKALNVAKPILLKDEELPIPKRKFHGRWQRSILSLHNFKDALAQDLLSIWDIEYEEENKLSLVGLTGSIIKKQDSHALVKGWLTKEVSEVSQYNNIMTSIPMDAFNMSNAIPSESEMDNSTVMLGKITEQFSDLIQDAPQSTQVDELESAEHLQQQQEFQSLRQTKAKAVKRKSGYVKGF